MLCNNLKRTLRTKCVCIFQITVSRWRYEENALLTLVWQYNVREGKRRGIDEWECFVARDRKVVGCYGSVVLSLVSGVGSMTFGHESSDDMRTSDVIRATGDIRTTSKHHLRRQWRRNSLAAVSR